MTPVLRKIARRSRSHSALGVQATAEDTLAALRDAHTDGGPVPVTALPTGLYEAVLQHFGSIAVARARLGIAPPDRARVWSRKKVLAELRRLFRAGVDLTATNLRRQRGLLGAIRNHVGGLREARALAGLPEPDRAATTPTNVWDDLEVARVIEQRARNGEPLAASQVPSRLYAAACKHWGSWARAIEAAGLDYTAIRRVRASWTKTEIITELGRLRRAHPAMAWSQLSTRGVGRACTSGFGSLDRALRAARLTGWPLRIKRRIDPASFASLRASLRALERRGVPLTARAIASHDLRLLRVLRRTIPGPWPEVLAALGFEDPTPRWDRERVLVELRAAHAREQSLNARSNDNLAAHARYHFGSLAKAAQAVGLGVRIRPHLHRSREDVLGELRRLAEGVPYVSTRRAGRALASAAVKHFGTWRRACEAAGVVAGSPGGTPPGTPRRRGHAKG
jgi:hypothetical protein